MWETLTDNWLLVVIAVLFILSILAGIYTFVESYHHSQQMAKLDSIQNAVRERNLNALYPSSPSNSLSSSL